MLWRGGTQFWVATIVAVVVAVSFLVPLSRGQRVGGHVAMAEVIRVDFREVRASGTKEASQKFADACRQAGAESIEAVLERAKQASGVAQVTTKSGASFWLTEGTSVYCTMAGAKKTVLLDLRADREEIVPGSRETVQGDRFVRPLNIGYDIFDHAANSSRNTGRTRVLLEDGVPLVFRGGFEDGTIADADGVTVPRIAAEVMLVEVTGTGEFAE